MSLETIKTLLSDLDYDSLIILDGLIQTKILEQTSPDAASFFYGKVRDDCVKKFTTIEVDFMVPWTHLSATRKQQFASRWNKQSRYFRKLGIRVDCVGPLMSNLIVDMIDKPRFDQALAALPKLDQAFEKAYPNYSTSKEAIKILNALLPSS